MRVLRTIAELHSALAQHRQAGARIGLIPTMGAFHGGHLSLMARARRECDEVVVSLFVNPAQFNDPDDLAVYPQDEGRDVLLADGAGVDLLFIPSAHDLYPDGFATTVSVAGLTDVLEGAQRGHGHFDGVTTVVLKLLNIVRPDVAYFGQKDAQQAHVIERMLADLNLSVELEVCATIREPDGLAMSSRNVKLSAAERDRATALHRSLLAAGERVASGERDAAVLAAQGRAELEAAGLLPDYFEIVDPDTFAPITAIDGHPVLALAAARVGDTRLIDNHQLRST